MRALGFDPNLFKYDPNEPREPTGNGRQSGQWIKVGDDEATDAGAASRSNFPGNVARRALEALAGYIARLSIPIKIADALLVRDS